MNCVRVVFATWTPKDRCWLIIEFDGVTYNNNNGKCCTCGFYEVVVKRI